MKKVLIPGYVAAILGVIIMVNANWAILQMVAWGSMLIRYSADSGIETGIRDTFSGERPCGMCGAIDAARSHEQESPAQMSARLNPIKLRAAVPAAAPLVYSVSIALPARPISTAFCERLKDAPPVPPPRLIPS